MAMGKTEGRKKGEAYEGVSHFAGDDDHASLEEAFEAAAQAAAADIGDRLDDDEMEFEVRIVIAARTHNQHVKAYKVVITPSG
jgi:hypothetical protein